MLKVYGAGICGECRMFKQIMEERGFEADYVEIARRLFELLDGYYEEYEVEAALDQAA